MHKGTVKYFNDLKGWGFITNEGPSGDVYVHYTAIKMDGFKTLREGQQVIYDLAVSDNGPRAENVSLSE